MNCANHPDTAALAFCRSCGKPLCQICERPAQGTVFCQEHEPPAVTANPYVTPPPTPYGAPYTPGIPNAPSPGLAFVLGLIPGVGAIYNGQYAKGLLHVIALGLLISIMSSGAAHGLEPLFGMLAPLLFFYMAFEAYHTAAKRQRGEPVDEFSSFFPVKRRGRSFPLGPIVLILTGFIFLLDTLEVVRLYEVLRYWPVFLILLGTYLLVMRLKGDDDTTPAMPEVSSER